MSNARKIFAATYRMCALMQEVMLPIYNEDGTVAGFTFVATDGCGPVTTGTLDEVSAILDKTFSELEEAERSGLCDADACYHGRLTLEMVETTIRNSYDALRQGSRMHFPA